MIVGESQYGERLTTVQLTDDEVQIIVRALFLDDPTDSALTAINLRAHAEFWELLTSLELPSVSTAA